MTADKMTQKTIETISQAQKLAEERRHTQVGQLHLLYALVNEEDDLNSQLFAAIKVDMEQF